METSQLIKSSQHAVPSPDGQHIASLHRTHLHIHALPSLTPTRSIALPPPSQPSRQYAIRWAPPPPRQHASPSAPASRRILLADDEFIRVYDLQDERWSAVVRNGSGGMGRIAGAEFGASGDDVLAFSEFGARLTVWFVGSGRCVEMRDPKVLRGGDAGGGGGAAGAAAGAGAARCFGFRPATGHLALLARPAAQDVLVLCAPRSYAVLSSVVLQSQDAQGVRWSADGRWVAVWEAPGLGFRVWVYTADGHLFRMYGGEEVGEVEGMGAGGGLGLGLGVKSVEWSPRGDFLAVGGFDGRMTLLGTRTFSPTVLLDHTPIIQLPAGDVWQEHVSASSHRSYALAPQPVSPPSSATTTTTSSSPDILSKTGMSLIAFNTSGTLLATKSDAAPTAVWLWDLTRLAPCAVLLQHSPVRSLRWHPSRPGLLLVLCAHEDPVVYLWDAEKGAPEVLGLGLGLGGGARRKGRVEARWLGWERERRPGLVGGDQAGWVVVWPEGREPVLEFERRGREGDGGEEEESEDSLFEALTGRKRGANGAAASGELGEATMALAAEGESEDSGVLDDTFHGRGGGGLV